MLERPIPAPIRSDKVQRILQKLETAKRNIQGEKIMAMNTGKIAIGTFDSRDQADAAVMELQSASFAHADIGVIARHSNQWDDVNADRPVEDARLAASASGTGSRCIGPLPNASLSTDWLPVATASRLRRLALPVPMLPEGKTRRSAYHH